MESWSEPLYSFSQTVLGPQPPENLRLKERQRLAATAQISPSASMFHSGIGALKCGMNRYAAGTVSQVDTHDFEEFREFTLGWKLDHQLLGRENRTRLFSVTTQTMQLARVQHSCAYSSQGENPKAALSVVVPLDDERPMVYRGRTLDTSEMGLAYNGEAYELRNPAGADHILATVSISKFEQYAADTCLEPAPQERSGHRLRFRDYAHRLRYVGACQKMLGDLQRQPTLLQDPRVPALLAEMLLENLLLHGHLNRHSSPDPTRHKVARRAYRYMLENLEEVPSVRNLCAITGVSYMTLERGFRELYGMGPLQQIKAVRLSRARRELLHPSRTTTVTSAALRWGFFELGRFSVHYRQFFGESPSETLRKARGEALNVMQTLSRIATA